VIRVAQDQEVRREREEILDYLDLTESPDLRKNLPSDQ
jgi:hypothetical protein